MAEVQILKQNGYNFLWIEGYLWMWDIPVEVEIQNKIAEQAFGDVLVAGYGLGIVQESLIKNLKVKSLLTVESIPEVIEKCKKVYEKINGNVKIDNFYNFETNKKYDCIIGDIWEDIIPNSLNEYVKFKRKAQSLLKPDGKILAWGKDFFEYLLHSKNELNVNDIKEMD